MCLLGRSFTSGVLHCISAKITLLGRNGNAFSDDPRFLWSSSRKCKGRSVLQQGMKEKVPFKRYSDIYSTISQRIRCNQIRLRSWFDDREKFDHTEICSKARELGITGCINSAFRGLSEFYLTNLEGDAALKVQHAIESPFYPLFPASPTLLKWKAADSTQHSHCGRLGTSEHILSNCGASLRNYTCPLTKFSRWLLTQRRNSVRPKQSSRFNIQESCLVAAGRKTQQTTKLERCCHWSQSWGPGWLWLTNIIPVSFSLRINLKLNYLPIATLKQIGHVGSLSLIVVGFQYNTHNPRWRIRPTKCAFVINFWKEFVVSQANGWLSNQSLLCIHFTMMVCGTTFYSAYDDIHI